MSRRFPVTSVLLVLALASTSRADVVTDWSKIALESVRATNTKPPVAARAYAMVHAAMFDAVNGVLHGYEPYRVETPAPEGASAEAAAACAAQTVLVALYPVRGEVYARALQESLAAIPESAGKKKGEQYGRLVGRSIVQLRSDDGAYDIDDDDDLFGYEPSGKLGRWAPTRPDYMPALLPQWAYVTPFVMTHGYQFRAEPWPTLDSAEYAASLNEVKELGSKKSTARTAEQAEIALFWADGVRTATPPGHWLQIAHILAERYHLGLAENARLLALLAMTQADAAISAWDTKFYYDNWRPCDGIAKADLDENPATQPDTSWKCMILTPPFPSYTSGHSTFSGASSRLLERFFGSDEIPFSVDSQGLPDVERSWSTLSEAANEAGQSRIYGGIHWQFDNRAGLFCGRRLADYVFDTVLRPIDGGASSTAGVPAKPGADEKHVATGKDLVIRVVQLDAARPVPGAQVSFLDAVGASDASGVTHLAVPPERAERGGWVCVDAPGFFPECSLWKGGEPALEIRLRPETRLEIHAKDSRTGAPLASAKVLLDQATDTSRRKLRAATDASGAVSLAVRRSMPFGLRVEAEGFRAFEQSVTITDQEKLDIALDPQPVVEGVITLSDGAPAIGADVEVWTDTPEDENTIGSRLVSSTQVGAEGRYALTALASGEVLQVRARDRRGHHAESDVFTIGSGELRKEVSLSLDWTGGEITVIVRDEKGDPVPEVAIVVTTAEDDASSRGFPTNFIAFSRTNAMGEASCTTRRAGPHWVLASIKSKHLSPSVDALSGAVFTRSRVDVVRGESAAVEILYPKSRRLVGRVLDAAGAPIAGAALRFRAKSTDPATGDLASEALAESDATGAFRIDGLGATAGDLAIRASSAAGNDLILWYWEVPSILPDTGEKVFQAPQPARIVGRLAGIPSAERVAMSLRTGEECFEQAVEHGADGSFAVSTGVLGDAVLLDLVGESSGTWYSAPVSLRAGASLELGALTAKAGDPRRAVVREDGGAIVPHCNVTIWDGHDRLLYESLCNEDGSLVIPFLPAVSGRIEITRDEDAWQTIPCADLSRIDTAAFVLHSLVELSGRLARAGESWVGRAEVLAVHADDGSAGDELSKTMSDPGGRFSLALTPGRVRLFAKPFGSLEWIAGPEVLVEPLESLTVEFPVK